MMSVVFPTLMRMVWQDIHSLYIGRKKNAAIFQKCSPTEFLQKLAYDIDLKVTLVTPVAPTRILIM